MCVQCTHYKAANNFQRGAYYLIYNTRQSIFLFGIFFSRYFRSLSVRANVCFHIFMWLMGFWCCCLFDKTCTRTTRHSLPISTQWISRWMHEQTTTYGILYYFRRTKPIWTMYQQSGWILDGLCALAKECLTQALATHQTKPISKEQWNSGREHMARERRNNIDSSCYKSFS